MTTSPWTRRAVGVATAVMAVAVTLAGVAIAGGPRPTGDRATPRAEVAPRYGELPLSFEPNVGPGGRR